MKAISADQRLFKQQLKSACAAVLLKRVETAEAAMQHAQESANSEEKSTAGDKYETARTMGQLDRDMNAKQWHEARKEYNFLQAVDADAAHQAIGLVR